MIRENLCSNKLISFCTQESLLFLQQRKHLAEIGVITTGLQKSKWTIGWQQGNAENYFCCHLVTWIWIWESSVHHLFTQRSRPELVAHELYMKSHCIVEKKIIFFHSPQNLNLTFIMATVVLIGLFPWVFRSQIKRQVGQQEVVV